ncbi:LemA family protein [Niabella beijingensis]|uniref:LemA family protein n=1 Tax=Niabella beijingensis TaxID=2872700 RepID=UPI001CBDBE3F|nr:LemA family protein [Niabella beijingensis]MBZ4190427.1 LemA family protein [Niabella beijingensis]
MKKSGLIIIVVLAVLGIYFLLSYNSFVKKDEKVRQMWSEVQNTYQRRLDLTPNLVNTVKGISGFEQSTLVAIADARSRAQQGLGGEPTPDNYSQQSRLQDSLAAASNRVIAVIERYPTLRGTEAYRGLQTQLEGNERRIKVARNDFNAAVANYNSAVRGFPGKIVAGICGFKPKEGFQATAGAEKNVEIKF